MFVVNRNIDIYVGSLVCIVQTNELFLIHHNDYFFFISFSYRFYYALGLGRIIDVIFKKKKNGFS